jgi:hypothetical protein
MRRRFYAPQETVFDFSEQFDLVPLSYLIDRPLSWLIEYILTKDDEPEPFKIRPIKNALLNFSIDLLRQEIWNDEYGCAMIYAIAVLGYGQFGWATPENFPSRISSMIKITRFFVLYKALRLDPRLLEIRRGFTR